MSIHCMVDLESFAGSSRKGGSAICQIGAVKWNIENGKFKSQFLVNTIPDLERTPANYDTIRWWMHQKDEARRSLFDPEPISLLEGLKSFASWYTNGSRPQAVWSHATFDVPALQNQYTDCGLTIPWNYKDAKDIRTLNWMLIRLGGERILKEEFVEAELEHNALSDALEQATNVTKAYNWIRSLKQ